MDVYFWGTLAVLFLLACALGWRLDRKRKGGVRGYARDSADSRGNEVLMRHHLQTAPGHG